MNQGGLLQNKNLLIRAHQLEAARQDKLDTHTMKDVNVGKLQESIKEAAEDTHVDNWLTWWALKQRDWYF